MPDPPELDDDETLDDIEITEWGRFVVLQDSTTEPTIELRNLGAATKIH